MHQLTSLNYKFVEDIPANLEDGVLYVSMRYAIAVHKCCCGCGIKVPTPFDPTDWKFIFDGETVSLYPSIGNWSFPCRSHYWINRNKIEWASQWTEKQIAKTRARSRYLKKYREIFGTLPPIDDEIFLKIGKKTRWWKRLIFWQKYQTMVLLIDYREEIIIGVSAFKN